ncbi:hypothetical protein HUB98_00975 [Paenibacillus barcinonensis]|uniref:Uncharacterized protein n=1 Tax=Paenibacillus barcinonensis TaxID=198119 RepID=A0A2V4VYA1_PAEBA|nr:hypothetical protein [Paenibacillus barcinonensis]PYE50349.1 hypothetical protein DFQ00_104308 [Paenibacillus barcinonensis]QKS55025.1 hypothetical protein HUB98_00975 [Paenibacillus barcinonensis]
MTYSQRLSGAASLSEIMHLEHQITQVKEKQATADESLKQYKQQWTEYTSKLHKGELFLEPAERQAIQVKLEAAQTLVNTLTAQLNELELALEQLGD